jgi:hypothetical protein
MAVRLPVQSFWDELARIYRTLGPPTTPADEDLGFIREAIDIWTAHHPEGGLRALLLGVTPAIAGMHWPEGSSLLAIDRSIDMINAIWPGDIAEKRRAVCADWRALPLPEASLGVVIGDGIVSCIRYPEGLCELATRIRRALRGDGIFVLRPFVQSEQREDPEALLSDLDGCPSFYHFIMRLLMAVQQCPQRGVPVHEVYRLWIERGMKQQVLAAHPEWEKRDIDTVEFFNDSDTVHTFPTLRELRSVLLQFFEEVCLSTPSYPFGDRYPTLVLRP